MKHKKIIFLLLLLCIQMGLVWPVYPLFSSIEPMVLGIPFSFVWVILMLFCAFSLMLWYFLNDPDPPPVQPDGKG